MTEIDSTISETAAVESRSESRRAKFILPGIAIVTAICLSALWMGGDQNSTTQSRQALSGTTLSVTPVSTTNVTSLDTKYKELIVGKWEMDRDGRRELVVNDDGTAIMDVEINDLTSLLVGNKLKFFIDWSISDGVLTFSTTGGEPASKVDILTKMYGKERVQAIKVLDETTLRVADDEPGDPDHIWTRIE